MRVLIKGGQVVDPDQGLDEPREVLVEDGRILDLVLPGQEGGFGQEALVIQAKGLVVVPGLIDMHVHLREPGHEYKETIASICTAGMEILTIQPEERANLTPASFHVSFAFLLKRAQFTIS